MPDALAHALFESPWLSAGLLAAVAVIAFVLLRGRPARWLAVPAALALLALGNVLLARAVVSDREAAEAAVRELVDAAAPFDPAAFDAAVTPDAELLGPAGDRWLRLAGVRDRIEAYAGRGQGIGHVVKALEVDPVTELGGGGASTLAFLRVSSRGGGSTGLPTNTAWELDLRRGPEGRVAGEVLPLARTQPPAAAGPVGVAVIPSKRASPMMRRLLHLLAAVALLACLPPAAPAGAETAETAAEVSLRPDFVAGRACTYRFEGSRSQKADTSFGGRSQSATTEISSRGEMSWTVDRVKPDGGAECTMTLTWMALDVKAGPNPLQRNDSREGSGDIPLLHDLLEAMSGKPVTVVMNADGSVASVRGLDAIRAAAENPDMVPDERDFTQTATEAATLPFVPPVLPIGGEWKTSFTWRHELGDASQKWTNTLTAVETVEGVELAVVDQQLTALSLDASPMAENLPPGAPVPSVRVTDSSGSNRVLFDLTRDEAAARHQRTFIAADLTIPLPDGTRAVTRFEETATDQLLRISEE